MLDTKRSGQFIIPGEKIGVIEEFIPNSGAYIENGVIRSRNVGYVLIDSFNRKASVYQLTRGPSVPKVGSIVVGHITNLQNAMAFIRIVKVEKRFLSGFFTGVLHVSDIDVKYTKDIFNALRVGDLVRAKVISDMNRTYHLSTKDKNLGIILASCSKCGGILMLRNRKSKKLYCEKCGNQETRRISSDYGSGNI